MSSSTKSPVAAEGRLKRSEKVSSGKTLALVGVFLAIAIMLALPIRSWLTQRASLDELRTGITAAQSRVEDLQRQRDQWQNPEFVEEQARLRLNYVRPGEIGLMTLADDAELDGAQSDELPDTWWGQLWGSVDESSGRRPAEIAPNATQTDPDAPR